MITDQQEEDLLGKYLDHMVEIYLQLKASLPGDAIRTLAHTLTHTTVRRLGADRKGVLVRFLHDGELLDLNQTIVPLGSADLRGAYLIGANLRGANLSGVNLNSADLTGADLSSAYLLGADLGQADLTGANLNSADLSYVSLLSTNLTGADLTGANLSSAYLNQVNLTQANLTGAIVTQPQLDEAFTCKGATLPPGLTCNRN